MIEAPTIVVVSGASWAVPQHAHEQGALFVILDPTVTDGGAARTAIVAAAPHAVVIGPVADAAALAATIDALRPLAGRLAAEGSVLSVLGAAFAALGPDGAAVASGGDGASLGLAADGRPVGAIDDDMPEDADTPSRRLRLGPDAGSRQIERTVLRGEAAGGGRIVIHADITDKAELEQRILVLARAETSSQLARGVVHDLNNAFCVISSFTDLLLEGMDESDPRHADLIEISRAGTRASGLTSKLVGFSRGGPARVMPVNLADAARRAETILRRMLGEETELALALSAADATCECDPLELENVLAGLVSHAKRTAASPGGVVTVTVTDDGAKGSIAVEHATVDGVVSGIDDAAEGVVELDAARAFASRFGGTLSLGPAGALLRLPRAEKRAPTVRVPRARETPSGPETVLLVEDEASVRLAMSRVLRSLGYRVLEARRGADAEPHLPACDVVITDLVLPGSRGLDLVRDFRRTRPDLPALIVTGYAPEEQPDLANVAVMRKPFEAAELARRVRQAIDRA